jgi:hypothetical protein
VRSDATGVNGDAGGSGGTMAGRTSCPPAGNHGRQHEVDVLLVAAGARVEPGLLESDGVRNNPAVLAALRPARPWRRGFRCCLMLITLGRVAVSLDRVRADPSTSCWFT